MNAQLQRPGAAAPQMVASVRVRAVTTGVSSTTSTDTSTSSMA